MESSVLSFPTRGQGGSAGWRGNFAPQLVEELISEYHPALVRDPMMGSGTTPDVCKRLGVPCWANDLKDGFDALTGEWKLGGNLTILHPPYAFAIPYSGSVWGQKPDPRDPSTWPPERYPAFIAWLNEITFHAYETMEPGGILAILTADVRKAGRLYPIPFDLARYGELVANLVKIQHNVRSAGTQYSSRNFIPIMHEVLMLTRKPRLFAFIIEGAQTRAFQFDLRQFIKASWPALVLAGMHEADDKTDLQTLYQVMSGYARVKLAQAQGIDWQAIVRRILQEQDCFASVERGVWQVNKPAIRVQ